MSVHVVSRVIASVCSACDCGQACECKCETIEDV